jgi:hypothetical protein
VCIDGFLIEELDRSLIDKDIDVVYHKYDIPGCQYKTKRKDTLKSHQAAIHDIDVVYYRCDVSGCTYKAKRSWILKKHKANIHDIDDESKKISIYNSPERRACIARFMEKRKKRNWTRRTMYDVRKKTANSRPRVKGRFL